MSPFAISLHHVICKEYVTFLIEIIIIKYYSYELIDHLIIRATQCEAILCSVGTRT